MHIYETTFILSPQADDASFDRQIKAVTELIDRHDGKIVQENRWGIRRLAYPIKKFTQGYYTRLIFEGNNKMLSELERFFKLEDPYIRYLTVVFEGILEEKATEETALKDRSISERKKPVEPVSVKAETPVKTVPDEPSSSKPVSSEPESAPESTAPTESTDAVNSNKEKSESDKE